VELIFFGNGASNFGDDLNAIIWKNVFPSWVFEMKDVALVGIGTVFTDQWTNSPRIQNKRVFVLGSGAGYWPLPRDYKSWTLLALRGPLSAALVEQPKLAATDAAALLSVLPTLVPKRKKNNRILLMPHHDSIPGAHWQKVAEAAGVTFVDPSWSTEVILEHYAEAKLVLAEAMHGAIVADTLRIPWIPWAASPHLLPFKWIDWTMSLDLQYRPTLLPPTSTWGRWRHSIAQYKYRNASVKPSLQTMAIKEPSALIADFRARYSGTFVPKRKSQKMLRSSLRRAVIGTSKVFDRGDIGPAAEAVAQLAKQQPYLSDDRSHQDGVIKLQEAAEKLVRILQ
jgi:succinoglycan biosynthesis protein ExoV